MTKYQYNYSFLNNWMDANPHIANKDILQAIGSTSGNSLNLYLQHKCPMPLISILRFCNAFNVPISAFIVGAGNEVMPSANDQLEPDGGYLVNGAKRPMGSRGLRDPLDVDKRSTRVPGLSEENKNTKESTSVDTETQDINFSTLNRMLDIIAEQQKLIAQLTRQINAPLTSCMVAEDIHHDTK